MTNVLPKKGELGPFLKSVDGEILQFANNLKWQTTDILDTNYLFDVSDDYLFDTQIDAPSQALLDDIGYPIQSAPIDFSSFFQYEDGTMVLLETNDVVEPE